ncbi:alanyl-tRNA editing protein [Planococcus shenhongbingii]|uniref:Alanyl-tRNA editing protein n=1 Tax=Planococcus shenhongbingii TaxID=3058398 RepID=A0ABT8NB39_9BACL|nr:alanyl-tRNA editing protein [Planococcus sp. N017]MDN7245101.1 alanyl-tRNA editing protein [Planococcus sp. N017]
MTKELFLEDSYLKTCGAEITSIDGNKVALNRTIFYPGGGGQEADSGILIQNGQEVQVTKVKKEGREIFHYISTPEKLVLGTVTATVDWERRESLMKHHTLLHVISAVFHQQQNSLCTGNQIYPDKARIDLTDITDLSSEELDALIAKANEELARNHKVTVRTVPREEAENISGMIKTIVNLIPESVKDIRLVKIGDIDEQACGGTHVNETGSVGQFVLDKTKNKGKGITRLEVHMI